MTILAAIGGEHERDDVVDTGYDLAQAYGDDLVVLHVMAQNQYEKLRGSTDISNPVVVAGGDEDTGLMYISSPREVEYDLEMAVADAEGVARECAVRTLGEETGEEIQTEGRVGDPAEHVVEVADHLDARFIVVGGRKRSPVGKALFGSVSQAVILNSDRPVVSITREE